MTESNEKALVLFVAAEPRGSSPIRLGTEFRDIIDEVERKGRDSGIEFRTLWAARPIDVTRAMSEYEPVVVHFSGHGTPDGGFLLEAVDGSAEGIDRNAMGSMFNTYKKRVRAVILNSCYSEALAKEIAKYVDVVIGMREEIGIDAAIRFSVGLYRGLAAGESLHQSFKMACTELDVAMLPESHIPVLWTRPGVEAFDIFAFGSERSSPGVRSSPEKRKEQASSSEGRVSVKGDLNGSGSRLIGNLDRSKKSRGPTSGTVEVEGSVTGDGNFLLGNVKS